MTAVFQLSKSLTSCFDLSNLLTNFMGYKSSLVIPGQRKSHPGWSIVPYNCDIIFFFSLHCFTQDSQTMTWQRIYYETVPY